MVFTFLYNEKTEQNILKNLVADVILSMYGRYPLYHSQANIKMNMEEHEMSTQNFTEEGPYILLCNCGCDTGLVFRADEYLYISPVASCFMMMQDSNKKLSDKKLLKAYGKGKILADMVVTEKDLKGLLKYLESMKGRIINETDAGKSYSHIDFNVDTDWFFSVYLISDLKDKMILKGEMFRAYEIVLNKDGYKKLVKRLKAILKTGRKKDEEN